VISGIFSGIASISTEKRPNPWPNHRCDGIRVAASDKSGNVSVVRHPERKISIMIAPITTASHDRNPGIVPPWLTPTQGRNPGIVPPWLADPIRILPVDDEPEFTILPVDGDTQFVPQSVDASPASLADALRGR
jgi:hypothetical protein